MINTALLKQNIKSNFKMLLLFFAVLAMYIVVIVMMYNPEIGSALALFEESMPELMSAVGMTGDASTLMGFLVTYVYGFIVLLIPLVLTIVMANKLVAVHTDKGSMAYLLASPNSRYKIVMTQCKTLGIFILVTVVFITLITVVTCQLLFPNELDITTLLLLNVGLLIFQFTLGGICFLASCVCNESKHSLLFGAGIPFIFFLLQMALNVGDKLSFLKYITIFTLFDPQAIIQYEIHAFVYAGVTLLIGLVLYVTAITIFIKKDFCV